MSRKIAYIANPCSIHDCKWINRISETNEVIVITYPFDKTKSLLNNNIDVYTILPSTYPHKNIFTKIKVKSVLRKLINKENIDIIHTMYPYPNSFWVNDIKFKPHVITTRGSDILVDYKNLKKNQNNLNNYLLLKYESTLKNASFITSTSVKQQKVISTIFPQQKTEVIPTGIDVDLYVKSSKINDVTSLKKEVFVLFSPRSMKPIYNIDLIIDAFKIFVSVANNARLTLIDDFPDSEYSTLIKNKIKELALNDNVDILSKQTQNDIIKQYLKSSIVISVPKSDGTPNSLLEAMLLKTPIISNQSISDNPLFDTILKIKENTPEALSLEMKNLFMNNQSDEYLNNNKEIVVQKASLNSSVKKIKQIYQSV